ncbi:MAG TPA: ferredoxin [Holophagaceae bacterium]|nr:ferredoxin [Holophagaceae bacterium]
MICCACEFECPEVFKMDDAQAESVRSAGFTPDAGTYFESHREKIEAAAHGCCVSVIGIEYTDGTFSPLGNHPGKVEHVVPDAPELTILKAGGA